MTNRATKPNSSGGTLHEVCGVGVRIPWSQPIPHLTQSKDGICWGPRLSSRAESKLSPCVARPNLFSGD